MRDTDGGHVRERLAGLDRLRVQRSGGGALNKFIAPIVCTHSRTGSACRQP